MFFLGLLILGVLNYEDLPAAILCNVGFDYRNGTFDSVTIAKAAPIFQFNYKQGKTYKIPGQKQTTEQIIFNLPDEMDIRDNVISQFNSFEGEYSNFHLYATAVIKSWHIGGGLTIDGFGIKADFSHEIGKIRSEMEEHDKAFYFSNCLYLLYFAEPYSYLLLKFDEAFQLFVDNMPRQVKTERDKKIITEFILHYGTHFPEQGYFGGKYKFDSNLKSDFVNKTTEKWVSNQFSLSFYFQSWDLTIGGGFFHNKSEIKIDEKFKKAVTAEEFYEGGDVTYQTNATLLEWRTSISKMQVMTNGTLTPMWELFGDQQQYAVVKQAISNYVKTGDPFKPKSSFQDFDLGIDAIFSGFDHVTSRVKNQLFQIDTKGLVTIPDETEEDIIVEKYSSPADCLEKYSKRIYQNHKLYVSRKFTDMHQHDYNFATCYKRKKLHFLSFNDEISRSHSELFTKAVNELPETYNKMTYRIFIKQFGTSFVRKVLMGGEYQMDVLYDKSVDIDTVLLENLFSKYLRTTTKTIDMNFGDIRRIDFNKIGGDYEITNWEDFSYSVNVNPSPIKYFLTPIHVLVKNPIKRLFVEKAVIDYVEDLKNDIDQFVKHV